MTGIEERAALHAALGEPGRLAVVELLQWGDRTPSELADLLGMRSNLLAHHVNVLVEHGLVRRTPSEGDRRRTYLSLVPGALDALTAPSACLRRRPGGCSSSARPTRRGPSSPRRCGSSPARSRRRPPAPTPRPASTPGAERAARRHHLPALGVPQALGAVHADGDFVVTVCDRAHEETGRLADCALVGPGPRRR